MHMVRLLLLLGALLCADGATVLWSSSATSGQLRWWDASNWANRK